MNIIFLTLVGIKDIKEEAIYPDLLREFIRNGHQVYLADPVERREGKGTHIVRQENCEILRIKTLNIQKTRQIEKGLGTLLLESQFKRAIAKHWGHVRFDLILYATPPITFTNVVKYLKSKNPQAVSYLLLKDIFPQNAVDIGMFGANGIFHRYFRKKEIALYKSSDFIGCMSPANVNYLVEHNAYYPKDRIEVAPNSIETNMHWMEDGQDERTERYHLRRKYNLPTDTPIFIYGGNLGKPQGVDYVVQCLNAIKGRKDCFFLIIGNGTEYEKLDHWIRNNGGKELPVKLMGQMEKSDYDMAVRSSDVGLIFLDHRFTIPNYPSRLLNYLESRIPIICATDVNTDIGRIAEENGYGFSCESTKPENFVALVDKMLKADRKAMGQRGYEFLRQNYLVEHTYKTIIKHV